MPRSRPRPNLGAIRIEPLRLSNSPLLAAALAFSAGIVLSRCRWLPPEWLLCGALLEALVGALALRSATRIAAVPVLAAWMMTGGFAASLEPFPPQQTDLRLLAQHDPITVTGTIERVRPARRILSQRPFTTEQIEEQMRSVDVSVRSAAAPGEPPRRMAGGVELSLYAPPGIALPPLRCGDLVTFTATLRPPERYRDPGVWDAPAWMLSRGIGVLGAARADRLAPLGHTPGLHLPCLERAAETAASDRLIALSDGLTRHRLPAWLRLSHDDAAMLSAMVTGDRSWLRTELRTPFERTGSFHLLVVSGLHLAIFAGCIFALGRRLRMARLPLTAITLATSYLYAILTGFGQPVRRALAMVSLYLIGRLIFRERGRLNSLGFAALCLLVLTPSALFDAGLQMTLLTVIAVAGIALPLAAQTTAPFLSATHSIGLAGMDAAFEPRLAQFRVTLRLIGEHLEPFLSRRPRRTRRAEATLALAVRWTLLLFELGMVSVVIELAIALPMAAYFHRVTVLGTFVNVLVVPALGLLLPLALLTTASLLALPAAAWLPAAAAAAVLHCILLFVGAAADWRGSELRVPGPAPGAVAASLGLLAIAVWIVRRRSRGAVPLAGLALAAAAACALLPRPPAWRGGELEVTAIDVGQGDSLLVISPHGQTMLVDAGGPTGGSAARGFDVGEQVVSPYLWHRGIRRLDAIVLTHAHSDHMGGMPAVLENFRPRELWIGKNPLVPSYASLLAKAASLGVRVRHLSEGDSVEFGGAHVHVLAPGRNYEPGAWPGNNDSLVLRLSYGGHSALLEGDAEAPSEAAMLALPPGELAADLLKVGHHGSRTSTTAPFLARVHPRMAVISVGPYNPYHHPRWDTLSKLQDEGALTWRTDLTGLSRFYLDSRGVQAAPAQ